MCALRLAVSGNCDKVRLLLAQVLQWLFFEQYSHEPYIAVVRLA